MQKVHTKKGALLMGIRLLNARRERPGLGKAGSVCCCQKDSSSALRCAGFGETLAQVQPSPSLYPWSLQCSLSSVRREACHEILGVSKLPLTEQ